MQYFNSWEVYLSILSKMRMHTVMFCVCVCVCVCRALFVHRINILHCMIYYKTLFHLFGYACSLFTLPPFMKQGDHILIYSIRGYIHCDHLPEYTVLWPRWGKYQPLPLFKPQKPVYKEYYLVFMLHGICGSSNTKQDWKVNLFSTPL